MTTTAREQVKLGHTLVALRQTALAELGQLDDSEEERQEWLDALMESINRIARRTHGS